MVSLALIPCRKIENPKKELTNNKGETIHTHTHIHTHIYNRVMGMGLLGKNPIAQ